MAHQLQCVIDPAVGDQFKKRRLDELNRQPLLQRVVKESIACRIREIAQDDGVFVGEGVRLQGSEVVEASNNRSCQCYREDGNPPHLHTTPRLRRRKVRPLRRRDARLTKCAGCGWNGLWWIDLLYRRDESVSH